MRWLVGLSLLSAVGCGRIAFDPLASDATGDGVSFRPVGYIKASNPGAGDSFGSRVALSGDGLTLAVGAPNEDSNAIGLDGNGADESRTDSGAVYVFVRQDGTWVQQAYLKASNPDPDDFFGVELAMSADGTVLAVGSYFEDSGATGVNGDQSSNSAPSSGAVYVFTRSGPTWTQQSYLKASNAQIGDVFGGVIALSPDASRLAIAAPYENCGSTGINGNETTFTASNAGAVYVFRNAGTTWIQEAYVKASNTDPEDVFGAGMALSDDGSTLAIGARYEDSAAVGIGGDQGNNGAEDAGALYVFTRTDTTWSQQAYLKASNTESFDDLGYRVALERDGSRLLAGAFLEDSVATGVDGDATSDAAMNAGAAYAFVRTGTVWSFEAYLKASNTDAGDRFGLSVATDGGALVIGASSEAGGAININGDQNDNSRPGAGALYRFERAGASWQQTAYVKASNTDADDGFGAAHAYTTDSRMFAVGAPGEASAASGIGGDQLDNTAPGAGAVYVFERE